MERAQKETLVGTIKDRFDRMTSAVFLDFKGLNVEAVSKLRDEFRKSGVEYRVVKNTLVRRAIMHHGWAKGLKSSLVGMTGVAFCYEDPSAAAKVVKEFRKSKEHEKLKIKAGLIDGQVLTPDAVETQLATMPGKNELRATLLMTLQAPLQQFLQQLNAPAQNFVYVLKAKEDKANEGAPAAPAG
jgi:large subunit ribosomal protein L10